MRKIGEKMNKLDYKKSNLNLINSILNYYGVENKYPTLKQLDQFLNKKYQNIVLFVLDGLGKNYLVNNLRKGLFIDNLVGEMHAVFPPTTVASTTTYISGEPPISHGWLGWTMYFKEIDKIVTTFNGYLPYEQRSIGLNYQEVIKYKNIFEKIRETGVKSYNITHDYIVRENKEYYVGYKNLNDGIRKTKKIIDNNDESFVYFYYSFPDYYMHEYGIDSKKVLRNVKRTERKISKLIKNCKDTLFIITADHGHTNVNEYICFDDYPKLKEMLVRPFSLETRATSIFVKEGKEEQFKEMFNSIFGNDFILLSHEDVITKNIFGHGEMHKKVNDFVGSFLAIAVSDKALVYQKSNNYFKGAHAGLTDDELYIPLIIIEK